MSRPRRIQAAGLTYHVTGRGVRRGDIFVDDVDRFRFLKLLAGVVQRYDLQCHSYCEMTNHYHLAITTRHANISRSLQYFNGRYAQWWNWRHGRKGHLFETRFRSQIVQDSGYLANVCRYIVLNPVRAGLVTSPDEWKWSSYHAMTGMVHPPRFLDCSQLFRIIAPDAPGDGSNRFRQWVMETDCRRVRLPRDAILGDEAFVARLKVAGTSAVSEPCDENRRPALESIFERAITRNLRNAAVATALEQQFTLTEIARYLEMDVSSVSKIAFSQGARP